MGSEMCIRDRYTGNYSAFEGQRSERLAQQQAGFERQQARIAEIQRFIDRFKAKATKARQAQSRVKALERMERIAPAHIDSPFSFEFPVAEKVSNPLLSIRNGKAGHGSTAILNSINLTLLPGSRVGLLGPNGAGKSTLLMAISGLQPLDSGKMTFEGQDLNRMPVDKRVSNGIVQVPEGRQVFKDLSVHDNLRLGAYTRKQGAEVERDLQKVYGKFPILEQKRDNLAGELSGGQQQMLAIGRALMAKPRLLLLDEPSMGLAPLIVEEIFGIIRELKEEGITVFLVEQNASQALALADRGYVLETGRVVLEGTGRELLSNEKVREAYLGM